MVVKGWRVQQFGRRVFKRRLIRRGKMEGIQIVRVEMYEQVTLTVLMECWYD